MASQGRPKEEPPGCPGRRSRTRSGPRASAGIGPVANLGRVLSSRQPQAPRRAWAPPPAPRRGGAPPQVACRDRACGSVVGRSATLMVTPSSLPAETSPKSMASPRTFSGCEKASGDPRASRRPLLEVSGNQGGGGSPQGRRGGRQACQGSHPRTSPRTCLRKVAFWLRAHRAPWLPMPAPQVPPGPRPRPWASSAHPASALYRPSVRAPAHHLQLPGGQPLLQADLGPAHPHRTGFAGPWPSRVALATGEAVLGLQPGHTAPGSGQRAAGGPGTGSCQRPVPRGLLWVASLPFI